MDRIEQLKNVLDGLGISYRENEPMKEHTSFKIGGNAALFVEPQCAEELSSAYRSAKFLGVNSYVLGKGTNVLFDDAGYSGAVISTLALDSISRNGDSITCGAGYSLTSLARYALDNSLAGLSFAFGIPGSVGGGVFMNAGAYNGEISFVLSSSRYLDTADGSIRSLCAEEHDFGYRYSSYKVHPDRIILDATFSLKQGEYNEIKAEMDDFMNRRKTKQPLEYPSAGSVFKRYPGRYTAQMIDEAGLKGASVGGAAVSEKHAGFIINKGGATSRDVLCLIDMIKDAIYRKFGIEIECEVIHVKG